jgi:hypothetical protein
LAAALSIKSIFPSYFNSYLEYVKNKNVFSEGLNCDFHCMVTAYNLFESLERLAPHKNYREKKIYFDNQGLDYNRLKDLERLKLNIEYALKKFNISLNYEKEQRSISSRIEVDNEVDALNELYLLKFMVAGGIQFIIF